MTRHRNNYGFTLVESLVAAMILTTAVLSLNSAANQALRQIQKNQQKEEAWEMLDRQLTLIEAMGIESFIEQGQMQGRCSPATEDESLPISSIEYYWEVQTQSEDIDNLYRVTITIRWISDNRPHSITAVTLMDGQGTTDTQPL